MKGPLRPLLLLLTLLLAAGLLFALARGERPRPPPRAPPASRPAGPPAPSEPRELKLWQTTNTLVEDLRDALADPGADLDREWRRVSEALLPHAAWTLENVAPVEKSPRVRALLVLAAGVHAPDGAGLAKFLGDPDESVRTAADFARRYRPDGRRTAFLGRLTLPIGEERSPR